MSKDPNLTAGGYPGVPLSIEYKHHPSLRMKAATWQSAKNIKVSCVPAPAITDPADCIIRTTCTTICGSDLHLYVAFGPLKDAMKQGYIMGHEAVGIGQSKHLLSVFATGDRCVVSAPIACGQCEFCNQKKYSLCDVTNPSKEIQSMYGHRPGALFGYSHLTGGTQAEYIRVPFGDVNLLPVPDYLSDKQVLPLSDIMCTGWHGNVLGEVGKNSTVSVWGAGPIGCMTIWLAKFRGAAKRVSIDQNKSRLQVAALRGEAETINFKEQPDVVKQVFKHIPGGPTTGIDCVGGRYTKSLLTQIAQAITSEDSPDVVREVITATRKGGRVTLIGDYFGDTSRFPYKT